jgi:hypothetical protein
MQLNTHLQYRCNTPAMRLQAVRTSPHSYGIAEKL